MFQNFGGDFLTSMGRQAMKEDRLWVCLGKKLGVYLVGSEDLGPFDGLFFLPHAGPNIGVNRVGIGHRNVRIVLDT